MTRSSKIRLLLFASGIFVLAVATGWLAYASWKETEKLRNRLSVEQLRSFAIADHIQSSILQLNYSLTRFELQGSTNDLQEFHQASTDLSDWMDQQKSQLQSRRERDLLSKIDQAYDAYLSAATNRTVPAAESSDKKLMRLEQTSMASLRLIELGRALADTHRQVLQDFLQASQKSLTFLQQVRTGLLILLVGSLGGLFITIYRETIAPLRRKLVESHVIIERQEKLASLGVLAAGVAHEIRNPLTAIKARLFTQRKNLAKDSPAFEDSTVISNEINRLELIVKDVLQFARPNEPKLVPMTGAQILKEVCDLLRPHYAKQSIAILVDSYSEAAFNADPSQLKQVLLNLIRNSAESIEADGQIILRVREARAKLRGQNRRVVVLEVRDNGKGIPPEVQKRLFDPFFSTKESGTGLGLSIAARIVERHSGALEFQTRPGHGTVFGIVLPALEHE